jgi:LacI family transcriptional regulator
MPGSLSPVTLQDIAREADLSVSAVSMALAGYPDISVATRMRVREIGIRLNYRPRQRRSRAARRAAAAAVASARFRRVCLVALGYPSEPAYLPPLVRFMSNHEEVGDFKVEVAAIPPGDESEQVQRLDEISGGVDGLLIDGFVRETVFNHASRLPMPTVVFSNVQGDPLRQHMRGYQVGVDTRAMGHLAARTLLRNGHRRVAFLSLPFFQNLWYEQWYQGFRHAHTEEGVPFDPRLLKVLADDVAAPTAAAHELLRMETPPTGFVIPVPTIASRVLMVAAADGRVIAPRDIVIGATLEGARALQLERYPLISGNRERLSRAGLELLLRAMDGPRPEACKLLVPFDTWNFSEKA